MLTKNPILLTFSYNSESPLLKQQWANQITFMQQSQPERRYYETDFVYKPLLILRQYWLSQPKAWYTAPACSIIKLKKSASKTDQCKIWDKPQTQNNLQIMIQTTPCKYLGSIPMPLQFHQISLMFLNQLQSLTLNYTTKRLDFLLI